MSKCYEAPNAEYVSFDVVENIMTDDEEPNLSVEGSPVKPF